MAEARLQQKRKSKRRSTATPKNSWRNQDRDTTGETKIKLNRGKRTNKQEKYTEPLNEGTTVYERPTLNIPGLIHLTICTSSISLVRSNVMLMTRSQKGWNSKFNATGYLSPASNPALGRTSIMSESQIRC